MSQVAFGGFSFGAVPAIETDSEMEATASEKESVTSDDNLLEVPALLKAAMNRRTTVSAEVYDAVHESGKWVPPTFEKSKDDEKWLEQLLQPHYLFKHLDDRELKIVVKAMFRASYKGKERLYEQGADSTEDDKFHVIASGQCNVKIDGKVTKTLKKGDTFGDEDLMYRKPRSATIEATAELKTWALDRKTYTRLMHGTFIKKRALYSDFLSKISFLQTLNTVQLMQLADALQPQNFKQGEYLIHYGEEGEWFYIIVEGTVEVLGRDDKNNVIPVCEFNRGECVGEMEFLNAHKTVADVRAKTAEVRTAKLNRPHFEMCMGPVKDLLRSSRQADPVFDYYRARRSFDGQEEKGGSATSGKVVSFGQFSFGTVTAPDDREEDGADADNEEEEEEVAEANRKKYENVRRITISAEVYDAMGASETYVPPKTPKNQADEKWLETTLVNHALFKHLDDRELAAIVGAMAPCKFKSGESLATEGDPTDADDKFYVVAKGTCSVYKRGQPPTFLNKGDTFGDEELLYPQPRQATVRAQTNVECWMLDRKTYTRLLHGTFIKKRALYSDFLSKISFLQALSNVQLIQLADALQPENFKQGDYLIRYGEEGEWFYIIVEGTVEVLGRDDKNKVIPVCEFKRGDCIGEMEFLNAHKTVADVRAKTAEVRCAKLNRPHFEMCMGPVKDLLRESRQVDPVFSYYRARRSVDMGGEGHGFSFGAAPEEDQPEETHSEEEQDDEEYEAHRRKFEGGAARRTTVSAEVYNAMEESENWKPPVFPKSAADKSWIESTLFNHIMFKQLDDREIGNAAGAMASVTFRKDATICEQGEATDENSKFYLVASGTCSMYKRGQEPKILGRGETFGDEELLYPQPRAATLRAQTDVQCWVLDRKTYTRLMHGTFIKKRALYSEFLSKISFLQTLSNVQLIQLADALQPQNFKQGEYLIQYGEEGEWFYIIVEGTVEVLGRDDDGKVIPVCEFKRGDCIGEMEFLNSHKTVADVVAKTAEVRTAKLNRPHFEMCMGPVKDLLRESREVDPVFSYYRRTRSFTNQSPESPSRRQARLSASSQSAGSPSRVYTMTTSTASAGHIVESPFRATPGRIRQVNTGRWMSPGYEVTHPRSVVQYRAPMADVARFRTPTQVETISTAWASQGYGPLMVYKDQGGSKWNMKRPLNMILAVQTGALTVTVAGVKTELKAGDEFRIPAGVECSLESKAERAASSVYYGSAADAPVVWMYAYKMR